MEFTPRERETFEAMREAGECLVTVDGRHLNPLRPSRNCKPHRWDVQQWLPLLAGEAAMERDYIECLDCGRQMHRTRISGNAWASIIGSIAERMATPEVDDSEIHASAHPWMYRFSQINRTGDQRPEPQRLMPRFKDIVRKPIITGEPRPEPQRTMVIREHRPIDVSPTPRSDGPPPGGLPKSKRFPREWGMS